MRRGLHTGGGRRVSRKTDGERIMNEAMSPFYVHVQLDESLAPPLAITTVVSLLFFSIYVLLIPVGEQKSCHIRMTSVFYRQSAGETNFIF